MDIGILVALVALSIVSLLALTLMWIEVPHGTTEWKIMMKAMWVLAGVIIFLRVSFFMMGGAGIWKK